MSSLLHRLGRWCATHAWRVIGLWLVLLTTVGALAATVGQPLTDKVSIPGANFQKVLSQLGETVPEAAGGVGTIVLQSRDGAFTDAQRGAIEQTFTAWEAVPHVARVNDPFAAQAQLDSTEARLADGAARVEQGQQRLDDGNAQLAAARGQLQGGKALLAQLEAANPDDASIAPLRSRLEAGRTQLEEGVARAATGASDLAAARQQLEDGRTVASATEGTRLVSEDGRYAVVQVQFDGDAQSVPVEDRARIPSTGDPILAAAGVTASYGVEITQNTSLVGPGEVLGLSVAVLVLIGVLGTLVAAGLPLLVALLGVGVGLGGAIALTAFVDLNSTTPALALMLGLAVGIDYALFIVNRHRSQLLRGDGVVDSIGRAVATAGSAVVFAGATVVIALAALVLSGIPILAQMGVVAAATVAITVVVAITVSPAVLRLLGNRVLSRRAWRAAGYDEPGDATGRPAGAGAHEEEHGGWYVRIVTAKPWLSVLGVIALLGVLALPATQLQLGLPDGGSEPAGSSANTAYTTIATEFGPGVNGPIIALATLPGTDTPRTDADVLHEQARFASALAEVDTVSSVLPFGVSKGKDTLAFQIVPTTG
ncbi:MAG: MMPL family transporter, partial [Ornithinibacter sp.]